MKYIAGKGNGIDFIRDTLGTKLSGEYIRLKGNDPNFYEKARKFMNEPCLLRSDATCEDGYNASFAGFFESIFLLNSNGIESEKNKIEKRLEKAKKLIGKSNWWRASKEERLEHIIALYANKREVEENLRNAEMNFVLHKHYDGDKVFIAKHPNIENHLHMEVITEHLYREPKISVFDIDIDSLDKIDIDKNLYLLAQNYLTLIESKKLNPEYVYVAEGIVNSKKLVQIRPFLKKRYESPNKEEYIIWNTDNNEIIAHMPNFDLEFFVSQWFERDMHQYMVKNVGDLMVNDSALNDMKAEAHILETGTKIIMMDRIGGNHYLDHIGHRILEGVQMFSRMVVPTQSSFEGVKNFADKLKFYWDEINGFEVENLGESEHMDPRYK